MSVYNRLISVYSIQQSWSHRLCTVCECSKLTLTKLRARSTPQAQYIMIPRHRLLWTVAGYRHLGRDGLGVSYPIVQPARGTKGIMVVFRSNFSFFSVSIFFQSSTVFAIIFLKASSQSLPTSIHAIKILYLKCVQVKQQRMTL